MPHLVCVPLAGQACISQQMIRCPILHPGPQAQVALSTSTDAAELLYTWHTWGVGVAAGSCGAGVAAWDFGRWMG